MLNRQSIFQSYASGKTNNIKTINETGKFPNQLIFFEPKC